MAVSAADLVLLCTHEVLEAAGKLKDDVSAARGDPSATSALFHAYHEGLRRALKQLAAQLAAEREIEAQRQRELLRGTEKRLEVKVHSSRP